MEEVIGENERSADRKRVGGGCAYNRDASVCLSNNEW